MGDIKPIKAEDESSQDGNDQYACPVNLAPDFNLTNNIKMESKSFIKSDYDDQYVGWQLKPEVLDISDVEFPSKSADSGDECALPHQIEEAISSATATLKCSACSSNFSDRETLTNHVTSLCFKNLFPSSGTQKLFECGTCQKRYTTKETLRTHIGSHTGFNSYDCQSCDMRFQIQGDLRRHTLTHTGEQPFACTICNQRFTQKGSLNVHVASHTRTPQHQCKVCLRRFTRSSSLNVHLRRHAGLNFYPCRLCEKKFVRKYELTKHIASHTGEKRFLCEICQLRFVTKCQIIRHMRQHTDPTPHKRIRCGKNLTRKSTSGAHETKLKVENRFVCAVCLQRFAFKCALTRHIFVKNHTL